MIERVAAEPPTIEERVAVADRIVGLGLLILAAVCVAAGVLAFVAGLSGRRVHPDAVLLPFATAVPLAGTGALLLLAAYAMRCRAPARWQTQWAALGLPTLFLLLLALS